jgi:hypothetical protein
MDGVKNAHSSLARLSLARSRHFLAIPIIDATSAVGEYFIYSQRLPMRRRAHHGNWMCVIKNNDRDENNITEHNEIERMLILSYVK